MQFSLTAAFLGLLIHTTIAAPDSLLGTATGWAAQEYGPQVCVGWEKNARNMVTLEKKNDVWVSGVHGYISAGFLEEDVFERKPTQNPPILERTLAWEWRG
ncbi:hypothetical protein B0H14DRAFT_2589439 [Mycena olivaceomarginata]|nr:hypothetical protein B0H14DRAFT_2589439 [Mycena olivaceomarginata]